MTSSKNTRQGWVIREPSSVWERHCAWRKETMEGSQNCTEGMINFGFEQCFGSLFESDSYSGAHKWLFGTVILLMYVDPQDRWSASDFSTFFPVVTSYDLAWSSPRSSPSFLSLLSGLKFSFSDAFSPERTKAQVALQLLHLPVINCNWLTFFL